MMSVTAWAFARSGSSGRRASLRAHPIPTSAWRRHFASCRAASNSPNMLTICLSAWSPSVGQDAWYRKAIAPRASPGAPVQGSVQEGLTLSRSRAGHRLSRRRHPPCGHRENSAPPCPRRCSRGTLRTPVQVVCVVACLAGVAARLEGAEAPRLSGIAKTLRSLQRLELFAHLCRALVPARGQAVSLGIRLGERGLAVDLNVSLSCPSRSRAGTPPMRAGHDCALSA
jgi:hypothetical protein